MNFEQAMTAVEVELQFPADPKDFHNLRTRALFEQTGLTEQLREVPTVVVTGSAGKASTAHYLAECAAELFRLTGIDREVGLGTKPPLLETLDGNRERYQLVSSQGKRWIEQGEFTELVEKLPPLPDGLAPYDLRYWLLGRWFVERRVGLAIVEANIGFRFDPASVFPKPVAQLLTPIGLDHISLLLPNGAPAEVMALGQRAGPTWHKACCPTSDLVVSGLQSADVATVVEKYNPGLRLAGRDFRSTVLSQSVEGSRARIELDTASLETDMQTVGRHQAENAAQAAACLWELWKREVLEGSKEQVLQAVRTGLARTTIPGRMEKLAADPPVLLNAATGILKIDGMMHSLEAILPAERSLWVCMSVLDRLVEKEIPEWLDVSLRRLLSSPVILGFTATAPGEDLDTSRLAAWAEERAPKEVQVLYSDQPLSALQSAREKAGLVVLLGQSQAELRDSLFKRPA